MALDVCEEEGDLFFRDLSDDVLQDDVFARLLTFANVLITVQAMTAIAQTTLDAVAVPRDDDAGRGVVDGGLERTLGPSASPPVVYVSV